MKIHRINLLLLSVFLCFFTACSELSPEFQNLSSQVLGQAGLSSSQINTALSINKNLATVKTSLTEEEEYYLGRGVAAMVSAPGSVVNPFVPIRRLVERLKV